jgi:copper(I)-binding protein
VRTSLIAGFLAVALGLVGLIRGAVHQSAGDQGSYAPVTVVDAWVAAPVPPTKAAAAYFTVYNNSNSGVELLKVTTSAGATNTLHTVVDGTMTAVQGGLIIRAHSSLVLSVGEGHVMIEDLFGNLQAGDLVSMQLLFANLPPVNVTAKVYAPGTHP